MPKLLRERPEATSFSVSPSVPPFSEQPDHELVGENVFRRICRWERKKAERSGESFLLMLVDVTSIVAADDGERTLSKVLSALSHSTRETDLAGWFQEPTTLGVIFVEIPKTFKCTFKELICAKVTRALRANLTAEQVSQIRLSFHLFPDDCDPMNAGSTLMASFYPELLEEERARKFGDRVKRAVDLLGSALALILCSPLLYVISVAIRLTSRGPILFRQERVGRYGRRFTLYKFRSMKCASDPALHRDYVRSFINGEASGVHRATGENAVFKIQDDPRVTPLGRFLRKSSLDELPQFINVLKGEMSLVGPRPPLPYEFEVYQPWHWRRVLEAKPGITGLWQVKGRSRLKFDDMVRLDLRYAKTWSVWADLKILLQTPGAVFFCKGAY